MKKVVILATLGIMIAGKVRASSSNSYYSVLAAGVNLGSSIYDEYPLASTTFFMRSLDINT